MWLDLAGARTLAEAFAKHPAILFWDLGNETSNIEIPRDEELAAAWGSRMVEAIKSALKTKTPTTAASAAELTAAKRCGPPKSRRRIAVEYQIQPSPRRVAASIQ